MEFSLLVIKHNHIVTEAAKTIDASISMMMRWVKTERCATRGAIRPTLITTEKIAILKLEKTKKLLIGK